MIRFGINEQETADINEMQKLFVTFGVEDAFELRIKSNIIGQKVKSCCEAIEQEAQRIIDDAPEEYKEDVASIVGEYIDFPVDTFRSRFNYMLRGDVYEILKVLEFVAEKLDPEGGYDRIIKMSMDSVLAAITDDEKIDNLLERMKKDTLQELMVSTIEQAMMQNLHPTIKFVLAAESIIEEFEAGEDAEE